MEAFVNEDQSSEHDAYAIKKPCTLEFSDGEWDVLDIVAELNLVYEASVFVLEKAGLNHEIDAFVHVGF